MNLAPAIGFKLSFGDGTHCHFDFELGCDSLRELRPDNRDEPFTTENLLTAGKIAEIAKEVKV